MLKFHFFLYNEWDKKIANTAEGESGKVPLSFDAGGNSIDLIWQKLDTDKDGNRGNVIAYARLDGDYTHHK